MTPPRIVGISGWAGAGKDSVADILVTEHGYTKACFADPLRRAMEVLNPIIGWDKWGPIDYAQGVFMEGYRGLKDHPEMGPEVRRLLQVLGTEIGRDMIGEGVWVYMLMKSLEPGRRYVIPDMRYPNELREIKAARGLTIRVARPGVLPVNEHGSETALDAVEHDAVLINNGALSDLRGKVQEIITGKVES